MTPRIKIKPLQHSVRCYLGVDVVVFGTLALVAVVNGVLAYRADGWSAHTQILAVPSALLLLTGYAVRLRLTREAVQVGAVVTAALLKNRADRGLPVPIPKSVDALVKLLAEESRQLDRAREQTVADILRRPPLRPVDDEGGAATGFLVTVVLVVAALIVGLIAISQGVEREVCERSPAACSRVDEGGQP